VFCLLGRQMAGPIGWEEHGDSKEIALLQRYCQEPGFAYSSWFNTTELKFSHSGSCWRTPKRPEFPAAHVGADQILGVAPELLTKSRHGS
jgi:hypothetical protein